MLVVLLSKVKSTGFYLQKICLHLLKTATGASKHNKIVLTVPWLELSFEQVCVPLAPTTLVSNCWSPSYFQNKGTPLITVDKLTK